MPTIRANKSGSQSVPLAQVSFRRPRNESDRAALISNIEMLTEEVSTVRQLMALRDGGYGCLTLLSTQLEPPEIHGRLLETVAALNRLLFLPPSQLQLSDHRELLHKAVGQMREIVEWVKVLAVNA